MSLMRKNDEVDEIKKMEEHCLLTVLRAKEARNGDDSFISPLCLELERADARASLFHYTNVESLLKIMSDRSFRFSRIDILNDPLEKKPFEVRELYKRVFVACFTYYEGESIPLWKMYTPKGFGVRIDFFFKTDSIGRHFIDGTREIRDEFNYVLNQKDKEMDDYAGYSILMIKDVIYDDNEFNNAEVTHQNNNVIYNLVDNFGWYKSELWSYEKETRLVLSFHNGSKEMNTNYLIVPIDTTQIQNIVIRFDPWMSDELRYCVQMGVEEYAKKWDVSVEYKNSDLSGKVR